MTETDLALFSIHPEHATRIYSGQKRAELRKSFPEHVRIVFLYETAPVAAVTGAFMVEKAIRARVQDAVKLAVAHGIEAERAGEYYGDRENAWVIRIGLRAKFASPLTLVQLRGLNHYFSVPQSFSYLDRMEALTQVLVSRFVGESSRSISLGPISSTARGRFEHLMLTEVASSYADIDDDFVQQVLNPGVGMRAAFSTRRKHILEVTWGEQLVGFTVLTEKVFGAWKSGPTIVLPEFRSMGLGQAIRRRIEEYCCLHNAERIYCTCAESQPHVVAYLLNAGMHVQARLRRHLASDRDELVLARPLKVSKKRPHRIVGRSKVSGVSISRVRSTHERLPRFVAQFVRLMPSWYFVPDAELRLSLLEGVRALDAGDRRYSSKGRAFFVARAGKGALAAIAVLTVKRSEMGKINLVASVADERVIVRLLRKVLEEFPKLRRLYMTTPVDASYVVVAASSIGFELEGMLQDPFGRGVDHVCLGLLRTGRKVKK